MTIKVKCPNCNKAIETQNTIEIVCPVCGYKIELKSYVSESATSKKINLNEVVRPKE